MMHKPKILVIDESKFIRDYLQSLLQNDFIVITVTSGTAGLEQLYSNNFDVVIVDYNLKGVNGVILKEMYFKFINKDNEINFILLFGLETQLISEDTNGFIGVLSKPINPRNLLNTLQKNVKINILIN
jgi:CheY-like chemotaxis protein